MRYRISIATLLLPLAVSAQETPPAIWSLEQLMQQRTQVQMARAAFVEIRKVPAADTTLKSSGVLTYRAPDRLERETQSPSTERTLIENDRITLELENTRGKLSRREFRLSDMPALQPFFAALRAVLGGDSDTLQREFEVAMSGNEAGWSLKLVPRAAAGRYVQDIVLAGRGSEILSIEVRQKNGDSSRTTLTPESIELKPPPPAPTPAPAPVSGG